jgi:hypothetical protein
MEEKTEGKTSGQRSTIAEDSTENAKDLEWDGE